ncbi:hypothetical protein D8Y20_10135 [Mariprofundus sp. EBB-1]|uniref:hypothetical protein n=1 Tax=Mariprofundus sp. EBB-1 TaxID=2650971 RepID=UPI000EF24DA7|nr:hypothetical protein [Mariprofundus sp. EBB-1]RLL51078.1 hypothetical protein D8Y20_10135 [Mariprofundus sp. EBB-1]
MTDKVHFSFALSPRMRSFIELRDALTCLDTAFTHQLGSNWLHAACDLRASLLGDHGRKNAIPEVIGLFKDMKNYLKKLADDVPKYREHILQSCDHIDDVIALLKPGLPEACQYLTQDALVNAYLNTQKKHDWLGHKLCMQQCIKAIWNHADARTQPLHQALIPLIHAINSLNDMLNDFVGWESCTAVAGSGQITPERGKSFGLLVIALPASAVAEGLIPDISGNKLAIRLRFQRWAPGEPPADFNENIDYSMMLVPIGN